MSTQKERPHEKALNSPQSQSAPTRMLPIWPLFKSALGEALVYLSRQGLRLCGKEEPTAEPKAVRFWGSREGKEVRTALPNPQRSEVTSELLREEMTRTRTWVGKVDVADTTPAARPVLFGDDREPLWVSDVRGEGILLPLDPALILERHQPSVDRLRVAIGNRVLFENYLEPFLLRLAAALQGLPLSPNGLWREEGGMMEAALKTALATIVVLDARVVASDLPAMKRDAWMLRLRVAVTVAAAINEASALSRIHLVSRDERGKVAEHLSPGHESAYAFGLRESGRRFTLTWETHDENSRALSTLPLDLLYQLLTKELRGWLREVVLEKSETVLSVLENVVQFHVGQTPMERTFAQTLALGHKIAYDQEAKERAAREGQLPLLSGFAKAADLVMRTRIQDAAWRVNSRGSPLILARDGYFLRWPEALASIMNDRALAHAFSHATEEPEMVAQILATEGILMRDKTGRVVFTVSAEHPTLARVEVVQLSDDSEIHALVVRSLLTRELPKAELSLRAPNKVPEEEKKESAMGQVKKPPKKPEIKGFLWKPRTGRPFPTLLVGLIESINLTKEPSLWWTPVGLFVPEGLFSHVNERYFTGLSNYLVMRRIEPRAGYSLLEQTREMVRYTPFWNVMVPEHCQEKFSPYLPQFKQYEDFRGVDDYLHTPTMTGIIIRADLLTFIYRDCGVDRDVKLPVAILSEENDFGSKRHLGRKKAGA